VQLSALGALIELFQPSAAMLLRKAKCAIVAWERVMSLVIGLNSGSSLDGIDVVPVEIENGPDGYPGRPKFIAGNSYDWPKPVAEVVLCAFENQVSLFEFCRLDCVAGAVYAESARAFMREAAVKPGEIEVIGFDGRTICQEPPMHRRFKCPTTVAGMTAIRRTRSCNAKSHSR
jgi:1,6-anhydro-N-acetylmuramate kinase